MPATAAPSCGTVEMTPTLRGRGLPAACAKARGTALAGAMMVSLGLGLGSGPAWAIFNDNEARQAIVDLRARLTQQDETYRARLAEMSATNQQLLEQIGLLRRSLLDMNGQLDALRTEMAKLRGSDEQRAKELADLQRAQTDLAQAMDERLRRFEPARVTLDGREFTVEQAEKRAYDEAIAIIRTGDFAQAVEQLQAFQRRHPASPYADAVRFWLGNAQYGQRQYKEAIATFRAFQAAAPQHPRVPEALLAIANCQIESKDTKAARRTLEDLQKAHPGTEAAQAAKERLAGLK